MKIVFMVLVILVGLIAVGWLGLRVRPRPFPPLAQQTPALKTVPLPTGLPAPVERYYRQLYGDQVPVIESAVITGRATMSPVGGLKLPARFRFVHQVGQDYRHYFELTWFGRTIGKGNEHYLDGRSRLALPMGLSDEVPQVDQAANLSLWAEYVWLPAVFVTDPRVAGSRSMRIPPCWLYPLATNSNASWRVSIRLRAGCRCSKPCATRIPRARPKRFG